MLRRIKRLLSGTPARHQRKMVRIKGPSGKHTMIPDRRMTVRHGFRGRPILCDEDFQVLADFIFRAIGIEMDGRRKGMLESRLMNRLRTLNMGTFTEYAGYLLTRRGVRNELDPLIDAVTTKKTHFYREPEHFDFLAGKAIAGLLKDRNIIRAWSAGCSSGEEPYSIALAMEQYAMAHGSFRYSVLGSDISQTALDRAEAGEYDRESLVNLSEHLRKTYFTRNGTRYTLTRDVRRKVTFSRLNLLDDEYQMLSEADIVFFRNVGIYFNDYDRREILIKLSRKLGRGGLLFIGHSERIESFGLPLEKVDSTIFMKP